MIVYLRWSDGIVQVWDSQQDLADFATAEPKNGINTVIDRELFLFTKW